MNSTSYDAILIQSFGGPEGMEDVMPFLRNVTRGRNIPEERLKEVAHHYEIFGGVSPINAHNRKIIADLKELLALQGPNLPVYWGNRNWKPYLKDTLEEMRHDGIKRAISFATSAYSSFSSCRQYIEDIERALNELGDGAPQVDKIPPFYAHPLFIEANVAQLKNAIAKVNSDHFSLAFSAHSIPIAMADGCEYKNQLLETATKIASAVGQENFDLVFQSRSGPPTQTWLEPDVCDYLHSIKARGVANVIVQPIGFVSDHMEVVYDLDTEARAVADEIGLNFVRARTAGGHPLFIEMIRDLVVVQSVNANAGCFSSCRPECCPSGRPLPAAGHRPTEHKGS
jgi:protoporphyrin/coproporphyrin ferrochelatase